MEATPSPKTWMIRCEGGRLYDDFRERKMVAVGWAEIAGEVKPGMSRRDIGKLLAQKEPTLTRNEIAAGAGQIFRFIGEIQTGDHVVTYSRDNRTYLFGTVQSEASYCADTAAHGLALVRKVRWNPAEIQRDLLSRQTRNCLGAIATIFLLPTESAEELAGIAGGKTLPAAATDADAADAGDDEPDFTETVESAREAVKDKVAKLNWSEMQELVAGILRAMGYKTQVSPAGADRGKDIVASPDGFGFQHPRIFVEVKHRTGQMGSTDIRSFSGVLRHKDDRGLYVSTGGFSKDAYYEAERAPVPITLWTPDTLVRALIEHYAQTDAETKRLIPLKRLYVPA